MSEFRQIFTNFDNCIANDPLLHYDGSIYSILFHAVFTCILLDLISIAFFVYAANYVPIFPNFQRLATEHVHTGRRTSDATVGSFQVAGEVFGTRMDKVTQRRYVELAPAAA